MEDEEGERENASRMKELLSSYYGMDEEPSVSKDPSDIDSDAFEVNGYVEQVIKTSSLPDLLNSDHKMVQEIKTLDSDMQMLVYENYNKFITATDTIRKMRHNVESMETEMNNVQTSMESITRISDGINTRLASQRSKVDKLVGVGRLLKRLEFLLELPQKLHMSIEQSEYAKAVKYYNVATKILQKYSHIGAFEAIQTDAEATITTLKEHLQAVYQDEDATPVDIDEYTGLLLQLQSNQEERRTDYLCWYRRYLEKNLKEAREYSQNPEISINESIQHANEVFLSPFIEMTRSYRDLFEHDISPNFLDYAKKLSVMYFQLCGEAFQGSTRDEVDHSPREKYEEIVSAIRVFMNRFKNAQDVLPEAKLSDKTVELIEASVRFHVEKAFHTLQIVCVDQIAKLNTIFETSSQDSQAPDLREMYLCFTSEIENQTCEVIANLKPLVHIGEGLLDEMTHIIILLIQGRFQLYITWIGAVFEYYITAPYGEESVDMYTRGQKIELPRVNVTPELILVLALICQKLSLTVISNCGNALTEILPNLHSLQGANETRDMIDVTRLCQHVLDNGNKLMQHFVALSGRHLSLTIRKGVELLHNSEAKEPRDIKNTTEYFLRQMASVTKKIASILDEPTIASLQSNATTRDFRRTTAVPSARQSQLGVHLEIERIFATRIQVHGPVEYKLESLLNSIFRVIFKAYLEYARLSTFSKYGFQQLQVDAQFLRMVLPQFVKDTNTLDDLLAEVIAAALDRATDAVPMEPR